MAEYLSRETEQALAAISAEEERQREHFRAKARAQAQEPQPPQRRIETLEEYAAAVRGAQSGWVSTPGLLP
jgi:hypothetical protein